MISIGWDIGGAHVKAAVVNQTGEITRIFQQPCPLWKGLEYLRLAVKAIMQALPPSQYRHAITMTGELVDLFAGREDGVRQIINIMSEQLNNDGLLIFAGQYGLLNIANIDEKYYQDIASLNWLASAQFVAQKTGKGLFVDIGSTTTDILLLNDGKVLAKGYTDYQRLISRELVYTGIVRTAVMAVVQTVLEGDQNIGIMAEYFATMADVYRLTGELNEAHDQTETADGAAKTLDASARRLARMIGCDFYADELPRWQQFAVNIRAQHIQQIKIACEQRITSANLSQNSPLIGAGVGQFLVKELAQRLNHPYLNFSELCHFPLTQTEMSPADCAPAVSIAYLLYDYSYYAS